jgi:fatty acid desaturase
MGQYAHFSAAVAESDLHAALRRPAIDWPTVHVGIATYAAYGLLTWHFHALPWWILPILGGYIVALHGSLQHEAVHGMPFRRRWMNAAFVFPSLWLWLPYGVYRETHLVHHRNEHLTSPTEDPESNYTSPEQYAAMSWPHRLLRKAMLTLAGRMLIGPAYYLVQTWGEFVERLLARDWSHLNHWLWQLPAAGVVIVWVVAVCDIPLWQYCLLIAYPGVSLTVMRSYLEHRAAAEPDHRSALVEAGPVFSLMFLNNNLHLLHHAYPAEPWHQRAARYHREREQWIGRNNGYVFKGYRQVIWRHLFTAKEPMIHPLGNI